MQVDSKQPENMNQSRKRRLERILLWIVALTIVSFLIFIFFFNPMYSHTQGKIAYTKVAMRSIRDALYSYQAEYQTFPPGKPYFGPLPDFLRSLPAAPGYPVCIDPFNHDESDELLRELLSITQTIRQIHASTLWSATADATYFLV